MGRGCITLAATGITRDSVRGLCSGWVGRFVFRSCLWWAETDQNRWAEVFCLPFPLWVNTCLQVTVEGALTNTKSQFITRDRMLLPSLCCIHGKVLSRRPSGFVIVGPKLFYHSNYFCFPSIHLLSTTITRPFRTCFKFPTSNPDDWNKCIFEKKATYPKYIPKSSCTMESGITLNRENASTMCLISSEFKKNKNTQIVQIIVTWPSGLCHLVWSPCNPLKYLQDVRYTLLVHIRS